MPSTNMNGTAIKRNPWELCRYTAYTYTLYGRHTTDRDSLVLVFFHVHCNWNRSCPFVALSQTCRKLQSCDQYSLRAWLGSDNSPTNDCSVYSEKRSCRLCNASNQCGAECTRACWVECQNYNQQEIILPPNQYHGFLHANIFRGGQQIYVF